MSLATPAHPTPARDPDTTPPPDRRWYRAGHGGVRPLPLGVMLAGSAFVPTLVAVLAGLATLDEAAITRQPGLTGPAGPVIVVSSPVVDPGDLTVNGAAPASTGPPSEPADPLRPERRLAMGERHRPPLTGSDNTAAATSPTPSAPRSSSADPSRSPQPGTSSGSPSPSSSRSPSVRPSGSGHRPTPSRGASPSRSRGTGPSPSGTPTATPGGGAATGGTTPGSAPAGGR